MKIRAKTLVLLALVISLATSALFPVVSAPASPGDGEDRLIRSGSTVSPPSKDTPDPSGGEQQLSARLGAQLVRADAVPLEDTSIQEWKPTENFGSGGAFRVRPLEGAASALMRWDLSSIPVGSVIQDARLELYASYRHPAAQIEIGAYEVLVPWQESSATWNVASTGVPWAQAGCKAIGVDRGGSAAATTTILAASPVPGWYAWTITGLVQEWVSDPASNQGLILVASGGTVDCDFFSSEASPTFQPRLIVEYLSPAATATPTSAPPTSTATPTATASKTATVTAGPSPTPTGSPSATSSLGTIRGTVFEDRDGNGLRGAGEPGLAGATVTLATVSGATVGTRHTGADGSYAFTGLTSGTYRLAETNPSGATSTTLDQVLLPVSSGDVLVFDFGDRFLGSITSTNTPAGTATFTLTPSVTRTPSLTLTSPAATTKTATPTITNTPQPSSTPSITLTPSRTPTPGPSPTPTQTPTSWIDVSRAMPAHCMGALSGDTTGKPNNAHQYGDSSWPETGPEDVYILVKTVMSDLTVNLEDPIGVDHDVFLLYEPYPSALLKAEDTSLFYPNLAPGTYYIVVDGYNGSMGPYRLTITCEGEPTPTATPTLQPTATNTPAHSYVVLLYKMPTPTYTNTPTPTATPTPPPYQVGVNCGGTWYQASDGLWYQPDQQYTPGSWGWEGGQQGFVTTTDRSISNTTDDTLYQSQRYAMNAYRFTVAPGCYEVLLRFAEIFRYISPGQRVFSVYIEGKRVLDHLDMVGSGMRFRAWDGKYYAQVSDGVLDITFETHTTEYAAAINAIRVTRVERCP